MGMGILYAALSSAAGGVSERMMMQERSQMEEEKQLRIDEITRGRNREDLKYAQDLKDAPLNRLQGVAQRFAEEEVPVTADPVKVSTSEGVKGATGSKGDPLKDGLVGMTREQVMAYKDPDMLAQYDKQIVADQAIAQKGIIGQTRKRTPDEAVEAARDYARVNDMSAYNADRASRKEERDDAKEERANRQHSEKLAFSEKQLTSKEKAEAARLEEAGRKADLQHDALLRRIGSGDVDGAKGMKLEAARDIQKDIAEVNKEMDRLQTHKSKGTLYGDDLAEANRTLKSLGEKRERIRKARTKFIQQSGIDIPDYYDEPTPASAPAPANRPPLSSFKK